jgi:ABC-type Mn2+/Zn2+ transport system ATPase subunit
MTDDAPRELLARVEDASVGWGRHVVLRGVSFELRRGDYLGIVGPNGSGKSTLLRALLGLEEPLAGSIVRSAAWRAGNVPQRDTLEPLFRFRALEVVEMAAHAESWLPGPPWGDVLTRARREAAREALDAVGMGDRAGRVFRDLSGGQKQRVLIARALAAAPSVLVLDEPTTGMDIASEADLLGLVRRLRDERDLAVVLVSHSLHVVADEADRVGLLIGDRVRFGTPGEIVADGPLSELYDRTVHVHELHGRRVIHVKGREGR